MNGKSGSTTTIIREERNYFMPPAAVFAHSNYRGSALKNPGREPVVY